MKTTEDKATPPDQDIEYRLLYAAYARKPLNVWLGMIIAPIGGLILSPYFPTWEMIAWVLAIWATSALGALDCFAFKRAAPSGPALARWRLIFTTQVTLGGLGWSLGPTLMLWQATGDASVLLVGTLLFVCAVAMISVADLKVAMQGFILAALVPPAVSAFLSPNGIEHLVGLVLVAGTVIMIGVGRISADNIRSVLESQLRLQGILDTALDAVIGLDHEGLITSWNPSAQALFGRTREQVLGYSLDDTILAARPAGDRRTALGQLLEAHKTGSSHRIEMAAQHSSGRMIAVELAISSFTIKNRPVYTAFIADASERKASVERLALFRRVFDASSQCVVISDGRGRGLYQNRAHALALGYSDEEIAGEHFARSLPADGADGVSSAVKQSLLETGTWQGQMRFQRKDGSEFMSASSIGSIKDDDGVIQYAFNIFSDFSEELARRKELALAKEDAERANRAKSDFLSSMSHELRTPMNGILGFAQILDFDEGLNKGQKDNVQEILRSGRHLLSLINEVLDLAKIEAGHVTMSLEPVLVSSILKECWQMMQPLAAMRQLSIHMDVAQHAYVTADRMRLKQVLLNLLSNAIKYNREGGDIKIRGNIVENGRFLLEIGDTGGGIAPGRLSQLFQPFNRLGQESGNTEGTGIGLVIAQRLVGLMSGQVGVESQLGVGSSFWIELPISQVSTDADQAATVRGDIQFDPPSTAHCVLCIDDNPINIKLIAHILVKRPGIHLLTAHTPGLGIQLAMSRKPDLILLDINMPGMDGYQVLEVLKSYANTRSIPVVAVTANAMPRDIEKGLAQGLDDYLTKPLDVSKFLETVDRFLAVSA